MVLTASKPHEGRRYGGKIPDPNDEKSTTIGTHRQAQGSTGYSGNKPTRTQKAAGTGSGRAKRHRLCCTVLLTRAYCRRQREDELCGEKAETIGHILSSCNVYCNDTTKSCTRLPGFYSTLHLPGQWTDYRNSRGYEDDLHRSWYHHNDKRTKNKDVPCRPDIVIRDHTRKTITIVDVAVAWEPLIPEREKQKRGKYEALARDIVSHKDHASYQIIVQQPFVFRDLGSVRKQLTGLEILDDHRIRHLITNCQSDVVHFAVRGHLCMH